MSRCVLIPIDLDQPAFADKALRMAVAQAQELKADLHVLTVVPGFNMPLVASYFPEDAMAQALKTVQDKLRALIKTQVPSQVKTHLHVTNGNPFKEILKAANELDAEMIVIPSKNRGRLDQVLIGSVTAKVVERANCSVLVVRS